MIFLGFDVDSYDLLPGLNIGSWIGSRRFCRGRRELCLSLSMLNAIVRQIRGSRLIVYAKIR